MTVQEAEKAGMSDIDIALGIVTGELEEESEPLNTGIRFMEESQRPGLTRTMM